MEDLAAVAAQFGMTLWGTNELARIEPDFAFAPFAECQRRRCFVGSWRDQPPSHAPSSLLMVCADALDLETQAWMEPLLERRAPDVLIRALVPGNVLTEFFAHQETRLTAMDKLDAVEFLDDADEIEPALELSLGRIEAVQNPTVRLVDSTLYDALRCGASDVHLELQQQGLHIKYRLDGVLQSVTRVESLATAHQVISRIKVLADLDISEHRVPQDGRFRVVHDGRGIDFRVSIMPNMAGEDAVLRVLDRKHLTGQFEALTLDRLSFSTEVKGFIRQAATLPYGLLLVTGPTGSGKTTTLYAAMSEINTGLDKIITIEDPIEYQLSGILQIPVNEKKGLTFAKGLRSILRHDPDKIMVGEIRDSETAQIAVQAALTGHQVFTTVHANNVFDVIGRFINMGVDSYSLVAALTGIMAQRLVRAVCPQCARMSDGPSWTVPVAVGCPHCRSTGYKGRLAIAETLPMDDQMRDLLVQQPPITSLKKLAREKGFVGLRQSALALVEQKLTTLEEVERVAPVE